MTPQSMHAAIYFSFSSILSLKQIYSWTKNTKFVLFLRWIKYLKWNIDYQLILQDKLTEEKIYVLSFALKEYKNCGDEISLKFFLKRGHFFPKYISNNDIVMKIIHKYAMTSKPHMQISSSRNHLTAIWPNEHAKTKIFHSRKYIIIRFFYHSIING